MRELEKLRIDKWLWAARFYKTRSLAAHEIERGRVQINEQNIKPSHTVKVGDSVSIVLERERRIVEVKAISPVRGPATVAQTLYQETEASLLAREAAKERQRLAFEPADSIRQGRPTKRDRRDLDNLKRDW